MLAAISLRLVFMRHPDNRPRTLCVTTQGECNCGPSVVSRVAGGVASWWGACDAELKTSLSWKSPSASGSLSAGLQPSRTVGYGM